MRIAPAKTTLQLFSAAFRLTLYRGLARGDGAIINMRIAPKSNPAKTPPQLFSAAFCIILCRGLARGDGAIINMRIAPKSNPAAPYPGLDKEKFFFDTDADMLDLTDVSLATILFVTCTYVICYMLKMVTDHAMGLSVLLPTLDWTRKTSSSTQMQTCWISLT
jgi:hypothetical protein